MRCLDIKRKTAFQRSSRGALAPPPPDAVIGAPIPGFWPKDDQLGLLTVSRMAGHAGQFDRPQAHRLVKPPPLANTLSFWVENGN